MIATAFRFAIPLIDKHNNVFNVLNFGAKGDGVTDDTTAIQAALNAVNVVGGGTVYFPNATYLVSAALIVYSNTHILGQNKWKSIVKLAGASTTVPLFNISGIPGTPKQNIVFENLNLQHISTAGYSGVTTGQKVLIFGDYTKFIQVSKCVFSSFSSAAIYMSHVNIGAAYWSWMIRDNIFYNAVMQNGTYGVLCQTLGEYADISGNFFTNLISGVYAYNSSNIRITNNTINGNQVGIKAVSDDITLNAGKLLITGNTMNHNSGGGLNIQVYGRSSNAVSMQEGCVINNNIILLPNNYGIKITGGWGHVCTGNRILTSADTDIGIWLLDLDADNKLSYSLVTNNNIMCNAATTTGKLDATAATGDGNVTTGNILVVRP